MISPKEWEEARLWAWQRLGQSGIAARKEEMDQIEVADFGLSELSTTGAQILSLFGTDRIGAKLVILRPWQFVPQHRHPPCPPGDPVGKEEVLRGQEGEAYLYMPGEAAPCPKARPPAHRRQYCTVWHEVVLKPGVQVICPPNTWHWFQAGPEGAVIWSFSSRTEDAKDEFVDPQVVRETLITVGE